MTVEECYVALGGDYEQVLMRLHNEAIIKKFVLKFPAQSGFDLLCSSIEAEDWPEAFRAAHTLKGLCLNLNFTKLGASSSSLTEALRNGYSEEVPDLFQQVKVDYEQTITAIGQLQEE